MANSKTGSTIPNNSTWLKFLANYIKETETNSLDLSGKELRIKEVRYILKILRNSEVTELNLKSNYLSNGIAYLLSSLIKTKVKKLNVSQCDLNKKDVLQLVEVLEDSQISDLDVSTDGMCSYSLDEGLKYVSNLKRSKLKTLRTDFFKHLPQVKVVPLLNEFLNSSVTSLDLTGSKLNLKDFVFLFNKLDQSLVTELNLQATEISPDALQELSQRLPDTKIEKLNLGGNNLKDDDLEVLARGLLDSKVIDLDLRQNLFSKTLRPLFLRLQATRIQALNLCFNYWLESHSFKKLFSSKYLRSSCLVSLNLSGCELDDKAGEELMESLKFTSVTKLDISWNRMGFFTAEAFAKNVENINLTELDLSRTHVKADALFVLGRCLKESKLTHLYLNNMKYIVELGLKYFLSFLKLTEGSSVSHIEMNNQFLIRDDKGNFPDFGYILDFEEIPIPVCAPKMLESTPFTELQLASKNIRHRAADLVSHLTSSNVVYLDLADNGINNYGAVALANCLKNSQIRRLNLNKNSITSEGAKALAVELPNSKILYLHLNANMIEDDGLEHLAQNAKETFITELDVAQNPGEKVMSIDKVLWENKTSVFNLVSVCKQIVPEHVDDEFRFDQNCNDSNVSTFLTKCLWFCKTVVHPHAVNVLHEEKATLLSKEQIFGLMFNEFPLQFSQFIARRVEANVTAHVSILQKAEELNLTAVVEALLYNRETYVLDKKKSILHPYVYKLLRKYNQVICSPVEPDGVTKSVEYFTKHTEIEGAQDVVSMLRNVSVP